MKLDILLINGNIYDGLGSPPSTENIGISNGEIICPVENNLQAEKTINLSGLAVAPGFINIHSHSDMAFLVDGSVPSSLHQGITTEVIGNCGYSLAPLKGEALEEIRQEFKKKYDMSVTWSDFSELFNLMEEKGLSINTISLVGHGTLHGSIIGMKNRPVTKDEIISMQEELDKAMRQGAFGLSTGLIYPPGCYSTTDEIIELAKVLYNSRGFYASHIRGEGDTLLTAIYESISIGRHAGVPVEISHLKASGEKNRGKTKEALIMLQEARKEGLFIQYDQYPYTASATGLSTMIPTWFHDGGTYALLARLKSPDIRKRIIKEMSEYSFSDRKNILISTVSLEKNKKYEGRNVKDLAEEEGKDVFDFIVDLLIEEEGNVDAIYMCMHEEDVRRVMADHYTSIGTDAGASSPEGPLFKGKPHPRTYGTFPRVLGRYVRELNLFTLEEAIRKMTSLPARILGIRDRGIIQNNMAADLVIFNPETIEDKATYDNPHQYPAGIEYVIVNGQIVMEKGEILSPRPGKVIKNL